MRFYFIFLRSFIVLLHFSGEMAGGIVLIAKYLVLYVQIFTYSIKFNVQIFTIKSFLKNL
jgi:hypothetical protein